MALGTPARQRQREPMYCGADPDDCGVAATSTTLWRMVVVEHGRAYPTEDDTCPECGRLLSFEYDREL